MKSKIRTPEQYNQFYEKRSEAIAPSTRLYKLEQKRFKWLINRLVERELFNEERVAPIIDLGCQDGPFTIALALFGYEIIGVEISYRLVDICNQNKQLFGKNTLVTFVNQPAEQYLQKRPATCRSIVCFELAERVLDPKKLLQLCHEALQPNGVIYICVPFKNSWSWDKGNLRQFDKDSLSKLVSAFFDITQLLCVPYDEDNSWLFVEGRKHK